MSGANQRTAANQTLVAKLHACESNRVIDARFSTALSRAVDDGLIAAALVDHHGTTVGLAGAIGVEEAMPLAEAVLQRLDSDHLASRLLAGEIVSLVLDDRHIAVGIAKRRLFVVAVLADSTPAQLELVRDLRYAVGQLLAEATVEPTPPAHGSGGGSGSGPADLPLVEYGLTVRREHGKA